MPDFPPKLEIIREGTLTADGTEQELVAEEELATYYGLVSLDKMDMGDKVRISVYMRMTPRGPWRRYFQNEYVGPQSDPVIHFLLKVARYGFRVTLHQFEGVAKTFEYCFYKEV